MTVAADGHLLYTWPVSTGRRGHNTPDGTFKALSMDRHHFSREWDDAPMPYSIFFTEEGHAIHGTNEVRHLGHAASHGCVRLSVKNASILWDLVKEHGKANTSVVLTGQIPTAKAPLVARAAPKKDVTVTRDLSSARHLRAERRARQERAQEQREEWLQERRAAQREEQRRRLEQRLAREDQRRWRAQQDDGQRYSYYARERDDPPRRNEYRAGSYYRDNGPPPFFPFFLAAPPREY